jgi:two-component system copper resistance phosphate regulon response regulator CusR
MGMAAAMRILVVEDEQKVSALIKRGLTSERYAVDVAADGIEGLELAEAYPYDLMILDLMVPRLTGPELLQRVRRKNTFLPVLVLTALDSIDDKVRLFELGADDYLTKPFAFAELLMRVKALLRRGPVNRSSTLRVGELELDRLTQQVRRAGKRIDKPKFARHESAGARNCSSRNMIIEHVWDQSLMASLTSLTFMCVTCGAKWTTAIRSR